MAKKTVATKKVTKKPAAKKPAAARRKAAAASPAALRARVTVSPRPEISDPEGEAIRDALWRLGFKQVAAVRAGRSFEIALSGVEGAAAVDLVAEMCDQLLADEVAEERSVELLDTDGGDETL